MVVEKTFGAWKRRFFWFSRGLSLKNLSTGVAELHSHLGLATHGSELTHCNLTHLHLHLHTHTHTSVLSGIKDDIGDMINIQKIQ